MEHKCRLLFPFNQSPSVTVRYLYFLSIEMTLKSNFPHSVAKNMISRLGLQNSLILKVVKCYRIFRFILMYYLKKNSKS